MLRVKSPQDLGAGLLFIFIGCVGIYFGKDLTYGSARSMGPGYFPIWLSWIIITMGVICLARSVLLTGAPIGKIHWRPIVWVSIGVLLFGYMIEHIKLELALILLTIVATQSRRQTDAVQKIVIAAVAFLGAGILMYVFPPLSAFKHVGEFIIATLGSWLTLALFAIVAVMIRGDNHERQTLILSVCMAFAAVVIFVVLLGQAMPSWTGDIIGGAFSKIGSIFSGLRGR